MKSNDELIADAYKKHFDRIVSYIACRVNDDETARDLAQEVFLRLLEYSQFLYESAMENLIFTVARNLVNDHLRRFYVKKEFDRYMADYQSIAVEPSCEHQAIARDLERHEQALIDAMPRQRAAVYRLKRFEELSAKEISEKLNLSIRTVENHFYIGLKQIRKEMAEVI